MASPKPEESARGFYGFHLKQHRERMNMSQPQLGAAVHVSSSLISGIELGNRRPSMPLSKALDQFFGLVMFFEALHPRVIEEVGLPAGFPEFADAEAEAGMIKLYENFVITGLFQIEEYIRAVLSAGQRPDKLERLVAARLERQELLTREDAPTIVALLDESAVRRWFGGREVMVKQLEYLLVLAREPNVIIHVVPASAGICPEGAFQILRTPEATNLGYVESAGGWGHLMDGPEHVAELEVLFELIREKTLSAADSEQLIRDVLENL